MIPSMKTPWIPLLLLIGCASTKDEIKTVPVTAVDSTPSAAAPAPAVATAGRVEMAVTDAGFEPGTVKVMAGQPVTLAITRRTDATCAKDIVIPDAGVRRALPLGETVEVTFTPAKTGELKYGCAMDQMIGGVLLVE
jgi:plastocyanin domain-containing protein